MIKLNVWLTLNESSTLLVGELIAADPDSQKGGALLGQFRYAQEYLNWEGAFALDPIHLPLSQEIFDADRPGSGIHGVFEDSLPDDWGRRLLARKHKIPRNDQRPPQLLRYLANDRMGALSYSESRLPPDKKELLGSSHLEVLQRLAALFEEDPSAAYDEMELLFQAGSSPGGARPKALIQNKGVAYLAKFASIRDQFDVVSLEAATMELARKAGVNAAQSKCVSCGSKRVLLVDRFDVNNQTKERRHIITMQTLLGADGYYSLGYINMAEIIRKVSSIPAEDLKELFRQLVFNVLIGNTDDHLKNFSMICDGKSWKLSPAYDLVPNIGQNREHVLSINYSNIVPGRQALLKEAKFFGLKQQAKANGIIDSVTSEIKRYRDVFEQFDVPQKDIDIIGRDIENRLGKISS